MSFLYDSPKDMTRVSESQEQKNQPRIADCFLVPAVVIISALPYLSGLGFYLDDWAFRADPNVSSGHGLVATFWRLVTSDPDMKVRPVQVVYFVSTLRAFGNKPLPYHILGTVLLGLTALLLYLVLIEIHAARRLALAIALIYGLIPQYSTDRFWLTSQQAAVPCMLFALLGIYAMLRSIRAGDQHPKAWVTLSVFAIALSLLSYEVAFGLIVASLAVISWRRLRAASASPGRDNAAVAGVAITALVLLLVCIAKLQMETRVRVHHHSLTYLIGAFVRFAVPPLAQAVPFNFWTYCLHLPWVVASLWQRSALTSAAIATAAIVSVSVSTYLWHVKDCSAMPGRGACLRLIALGFILYGLGNLLFITYFGYHFSGPGPDNRVAIAAALGVPFIWVALAGLACSCLTKPVVSARIFSVTIGLICGINCLVVSGIAHYWDDAALQQSAILKSVSANVRSLPRGSVLLLDGFCRYTRPAIVFDTDYDTTAAIRLTLNDDSLTGNVVSPSSQFGQAAVETGMYGEQEAQYPYGDHLFVYNVAHEYLTRLPSEVAAIQYLQEMGPSREGSCPVAEDWDSVKVF